ncbi:mycothiol synthase [Actinomadura hallensis]|uniref:Mycothiol synthase n=1 Tax=Actinomadura hallensis TaxID=337895 RepID=A0A543IGM6_9ACTN|nr:GNAT family N-acetyltransferase [Actinomadura hallensis]TQM69729.1 mycothiol synthase [Actinomadura hallensis]
MTGDPMINHAVTGRLEGRDLEDALRLVREAGEYDEEAGFTRIPEELVRQAGDGRQTIRHLLVRGDLDDLTWDGTGGHLLAYAHLAVQDGRGLARLVVHPDYRSRGVSTLTVETVGLETGGGGWLGSGARTVRGWAYGHHPAAERLARRFGMTRVSQTWLQVRQLTGPYALELPAAPLPEGVVLDAVEGEAGDALVRECESVLSRGGLSARARQQVVSGLAAGGARGVLARRPGGEPVGLVLADAEPTVFETRRAGALRALAVARDFQGTGLGLALLTRTLAEFAARGDQVALMRIDPADDRAVRLVRRLGFERNQDDALYGFGDLTREDGAWVLPR